MTTITLEGKEYQLHIEQSEKLGLLKEKDSRVKSWKEFINKHLESKSFYCNDGTVNQTLSPYNLSEQLTPYEAKALAAFSKLLKLRRDWIGGWKPDWGIVEEKKYVIERKRISKFEITTYFTNSRALSFPSYELALEFLLTFRDLIEEAKILI